MTTTADTAKTVMLTFIILYGIMRTVTLVRTERREVKNGARPFPMSTYLTVLTLPILHFVIALMLVPTSLELTSEYGIIGYTIVGYGLSGLLATAIVTLLVSLLALVVKKREIKKQVEQISKDITND